MFEKEAEEYTNNLLKDVNCNIGNPRSRQINSIDVEEAYQNGAEFGYNKANEFHYCKDGLPEKEKSVLIYTEIKNVYMAKLVKDDYFITNKGGFVQTSAVIAWKEIVLPELKEIKENDN